ncbi:hypothetical protein [Pseudomonas abietaniphila]|uniref:Uncharacterized protein n=1 Tax=Pseudomonas abietaniphila TaxID=89065 RepID=A0A1G8PR64_9PSED|nr:hypothetical protein [Pseudomonas abietaniphila]SDI94818.1 hypothetical protein SAMN05216605_11980 [Pseudomonas abietaniphila]
MEPQGTEAKIIKIICDHYLSGARERLTIGEVSARANISRQAFHKTYIHLKPFLTGTRNIDELLLGNEAELGRALLKSQKLIRETQAELDEVRAGYMSEFKRLEANLVTTLMNGDVLIHHSKELTSQLKKKALHNEILKRQVDEKEIELSLTKLSGSKSPLPPIKDFIVDRLQVDLRAAFTRFSETQDLDEYYANKTDAVTKVKDKLVRVLKKGVIRVVIFQDRFISSFEKFVVKNFSVPTESVIIVQLPLASRSEIRNFIHGLVGAKPLDLFVPYCASEPVIKAQRGFSFGDVPEAEFRSFSKEPMPTIQDGFDNLCIFQIEQGD